MKNPCKHWAQKYSHLEGTESSALVPRTYGLSNGETFVIENTYHLLVQFIHIGIQWGLSDVGRMGLASHPDLSLWKTLPARSTQLVGTLGGLGCSYRTMLAVTKMPDQVVGCTEPFVLEEHLQFFFPVHSHHPLLQELSCYKIQCGSYVATAP